MSLPRSECLQLIDQIRKIVGERGMKCSILRAAYASITLHQELPPDIPLDLKIRFQQLKTFLEHQDTEVRKLARIAINLHIMAMEPEKAKARELGRYVLESVYTALKKSFKKNKTELKILNMREFDRVYFPLLFEVIRDANIDSLRLDGLYENFQLFCEMVPGSAPNLKSLDLSFNGSAFDFPEARFSQVEYSKVLSAMIKNLNVTFLNLSYCALHKLDDAQLEELCKAIQTSKLTGIDLSGNFDQVGLERLVVINRMIVRIVEPVLAKNRLSLQFDLFKRAASEETQRLTLIDAFQAALAEEKNKLRQLGSDMEDCLFPLHQAEIDFLNEASEWFRSNKLVESSENHEIQSLLRVSFDNPFYRDMHFNAFERTFLSSGSFIDALACCITDEESFISLEENYEIVLMPDGIANGSQKPVSGKIYIKPSEKSLQYFILGMSNFGILLEVDFSSKVNISSFDQVMLHKKEILELMESKGLVRQNKQALFNKYLSQASGMGQKENLTQLSRSQQLILLKYIVLRDMTRPQLGASPLSSSNPSTLFQPERIDEELHNRLKSLPEFKRLSDITEDTISSINESWSKFCQFIVPEKHLDETNRSVLKAISCYIDTAEQAPTPGGPA